MIHDVHHVGIAVRDMDVALKLYHDALGLPVVKEGLAAARGARVAMVAAGKSYLELIQPVAVDSPFTTFIRERAEGLHHIGLWSGDVELDVSRLAEDGVPLEDPEPRTGFTGKLSYLLPEAFDGAIVELVEPEEGLRGESPPIAGRIKKIDHVVLRVPFVSLTSKRFREWFGVETKRTMDRGPAAFAFMRPGEIVIEVIGPKDPTLPSEHSEPGSGRVAGLCFEVSEIERLAESLKHKGYPIGDPHPALQGGTIVSVHPTGACGVPLAFIDFAGSPGPAHQQEQTS
jgi:methylmalonyl-CoA/ethylmalonyl-CoA epimerase